LVGWLFGIGSSLAGGLVTPLARGIIVGGMAPSTLLVLRLTLASILLGVTMAIVAPHKLKLTRRGLWLMLVVGGLAGFEIATFFWSLAYVDAATSSIIKSVQPLVVLLLLTFGGERMTGRHWIRLLLSMVGIYLLDLLAGWGRREDRSLWGFPHRPVTAFLWTATGAGAMVAARV
jgi:drug/metabolite transporter (DMT)-like permease